MARYDAKRFQLGKYWLGQRKASPAWYRMWLEKGTTQKISLQTTDFEEAKQKLTDWFVGQQTLTNVPTDVVTMAQILGRYWDERGQHCERKASVRGHINHWLDHFGAASVADATAFVAQEAFKTRLLAGGLAPNTVNNIVSTGRAALRMAWKRGAIPSAPPLTMVAVGEQEPMGRPMSIEEAQRLLPELEEHVWLLNVLLIGTLARPSAVLQLTWAQVDFEAGLINLNAPGRVQNKKRRPVVKLPKFLREVLKPRRGEGHVVTFNGNPVKSVKTSWRKARERAKLDDGVTLYSWRHTLGRYMRTKGVPPDQIQIALGHRTLGVTERYAEFDPQYLKEATKAIEGFYGTVTGQSKTPKSQKPLGEWCRMRGLNSRPTVYKGKGQGR